jgi:hypothetical protein
MRLGQNACLGNCLDEFDNSGERSRAIMALLLHLGGFSSMDTPVGSLFSCIFLNYQDFTICYVGMLILLSYHRNGFIIESSTKIFKRFSVDSDLILIREHCI